MINYGVPNVHYYLRVLRIQGGESSWGGREIPGCPLLYKTLPRSQGAPPLYETTPHTKSHNGNFPEVSSAGAEEAGGDEHGEDEERGPVTNKLQPLIGVRYLGQVEPGKEVPERWRERWRDGRREGGKGVRERWMEGGMEGGRDEGKSWRKGGMAGAMSSEIYRK